MDNNKRYKIKLPEEDVEMQKRFEKTIQSMRTFNMNKFMQDNSEKCKNCIYNDACDRAMDRI